MTDHVRCAAVPRCTPQNLQAALQLLNIHTLAFTPAHTLPWRVYLYTRTQHTHTRPSTLILGELLYVGETSGGDRGQGDPGDGCSAGQQMRPEVTNEDEEKCVKVTLKQQPRDEDALKGLMSVLTSVLHALSSDTS